MAEVVLDARGALLEFTLVPPQVETPPEAPSEPDWGPFLAEAGIPLGDLRPAIPQWAAPVDSDRKWAWTTEAAGERPALRIEAAAFHGRPVWFRVLNPWSQHERTTEGRPQESAAPVGRLAVAVLALALPVGGILLARRRWPRMLISWKRLLDGRFRDPLVGRDVLIGCLLGAAVPLTFLASVIGPAWLVAHPVMPHHRLEAGTLASFHQVGFRLFVNQFSAVLYALVFLFMLVLLRMILRRTTPAMILWCVLLGGPILGEGLLVGWTVGLVRALLYLVALTEGGLLGLATALFVAFSLLEVPLTLDLGAWYATRSFPALLVILALAVYGFRTALAGKPALGRNLFDD
jgi:hypothetical protein